MPAEGPRRRTRAPPHSIKDTGSTAQTTGLPLTRAVTPRGYLLGRRREAWSVQDPVETPTPCLLGVSGQRCSVAGCPAASPAPRPESVPQLPSRQVSTGREWAAHPGPDPPKEVALTRRPPRVLRGGLSCKLPLLPPG